MHIHQPVDFVLGMLALGTGLIAGAVTLYQMMVKRDERRQPGGWFYLYLILVGLHSISEAFDLPHQDSHRTIVVTWLTLPAAFALFVIFYIVPKFRRRRPVPAQKLTAPSSCWLHR